MEANDFFRAYATALLVWQHVEAALFTFFFNLFDNKVDLKRVGAVYYSQDSFGGKLRIVEATAKVVLNPEQVVEWKKLVRRMQEASGHRNVLAHFTAVAKDVESTDLDLVLAPAAFVPDELVRTRKKYDGAECERLTDTFTLLAQDINNFTQHCGW